MLGGNHEIYRKKSSRLSLSFHTSVRVATEDQMESWNDPVWSWNMRCLLIAVGIIGGALALGIVMSS